MLKNFLANFPEKQPEDITTFDLEQYINFIVNNKKISQAYQRILLGAFKLFFNELLRKNYKWNYLYPYRGERKLPIVLDKTEVQLLLCSINNLKHRNIISLIYSVGLGLSEVV